jgi:hypothetical protein
MTLNVETGVDSKMYYSVGHCPQHRSGLSCAFHFVVYSSVYPLIIAGLDFPQQEILKVLLHTRQTITTTTTIDIIIFSILSRNVWKLNTEELIPHPAWAPCSPERIF